MRTLTNLVLLLLLAVMCYVSYKQNQVIVQQRDFIRVLWPAALSCEANSFLEDQKKKVKTPPAPVNLCDSGVPMRPSAKCLVHI